jgi:hypothetical protein
MVDLNPTQGREQAGKRPVVVLSIDEINTLPLVVTVVAGTKGSNIAKDYPTNVHIPAEEERAGCLRKLFSYASKFARWIPNDSPIDLWGSSRRKGCKTLNGPCDIV